MSTKKGIEYYQKLLPSKSATKTNNTEKKDISYYQNLLSKEKTQEPSAVNKSGKPTYSQLDITKFTEEKLGLDTTTLNKAVAQKEAARKEAERQEQERWNNLSLGEKIADPFKTAATNVTYGNLGIKENVAWNEYRNKQDEASLQAAQAATKAREEFEANNDRIGKGNAVTKDFAQYLPQLGGQLKAGAVGAAGGAGAGAVGGAGIALAAGQLGPQVAVPEEIATVPAGALTGAIWGGRGGYVTGTAKYGYDMMAGSAYKTLLDMGVPNDVALELSGDEALINSLIEGGGAIVDLISLGIGKLAGKGGTTAAKEVAKNRLIAAAKAYGLNLVSEPLEEMAQEKVSIETEKRAADKTGIERNVTDAEDWERIKGAGETALKVAAVSGGLNAGGNYITNNVAENINNNRQAQAQINQDIQNYKNTSDYSKYISQNNQQNNILKLQKENDANNVKNDVPNASQIQNIQQPNVTLPTQAEMAQKANMAQIPQSVQLPTQRAEITLQSAKVAGANDINMNKAVELNNLLKSGAEVKFYNPQNIPQGVDANKAKVANGFYSNGTVWINKNTKNAVEVVLGHELTHHLETTDSYTDLANTILDSDVFYDYIAEKGYSNVAEYKQSLGQNYTAEQFDSEMVANFVQDKLFSDQNSIDRLARQNTTLVEKIKNWISDLVVSFKGTAQEKELRRIEGMYRKALEQARNNTATSTETQYSYSGKVGLDNLKSRYDKMNVVQKEFVNELENNYQKALYLSSKGYKNNQILKETGWFESDGKWKWEIPDEYFKLKDNANLSNGEHNLSEIIEHDLVFMVYPELAKQKVVVSDKPGKSFYNTIDDKIYLKIGEKTKGAIELNLLHELQHSMQNIEGFDGGTSTLGGMLRYYEKHGEIEASDTVRRFKQGKKDSNFDRENVVPELSKENPKHPMLDKYLAGETKKQTPIRDYLYQKSKEKGNGIYEKVDRKAFGMEVDEADNAKDMRVDNGGRNGRYVNDTAGKEPAFSMPETDNQGRTLSKEQQEFFKDSKVRDENGKLIEVYHGTNNDFSIFDKKKIGDNWSYSGNGTRGGFFFQDKNTVNSYGSKTLRTYLNITNPYVVTFDTEYFFNGADKFDMNSDDYFDEAINKGHDGIIVKPQNNVKEKTLYVAFEPNQIKNVDNTNPTSNPDIRYSMNPVDVAKNPPNSQNDLLEEIAPIDEKKLDDVEEKERVASILTRSPKRPAKDLLKQSVDVFMRKLVDAGNTINTVGKLTGDKHLYEYFNNTKQARQSAEYMIGEAQTDIRGNRVGNSLIRIFESVRAKGDDYTNKFFEYLLHMHNIDRMAQNKPVFGKSVTAEDSSRYVKELLEKYPEFEKQANKVYAYNRNLMQWRVDSGLISQEQADLMNQMYPHYVPTFRDVSGTSGSRAMQGTVQIANTVRKATGSDKDIMPIDASMARQTMQTVQAAKRNLLGNRLLNDVLNNKDKVGEYVQAVEKVNEQNDVETEMEPPKDTNLEDNNNVFKIFRNGETYVMKVNNGIYEGLKSISSEIDNTDTGLLLKSVKAANNAFKKLITGYSPMFTIRNFARDIQDAGLYSKNLRGFLKKYPNTYQEMMGNGKMWQLYKSLGGTGSSVFDYETGIEKELDTRNKTSTKIKEATVGKVEELNMMIEQAPRFAEFMATIEKAGNQNYDTLMEAMLNAADITVNFGRSGTWGKALNSTAAPFLNPSIQGFDKFTRTILESRDGKKFAKLAIRATLLGILPSVINELLYWDDDEYENLTDRDKDTNFLIKVGDNKWLKIPKGRVLSIFGNTAARGLRTLKGEEWDVGEFFTNQAGQTAPISVLESNLYSPIDNVKNNKTWYGSDIVPQRLQDYAPKDQYDENTDAFSKWLGGKINYSPKKINYLIDAYTGIIGDVVLPLTTPKAETNPFTKAFVLDGVSSNEISNDFYDMMDKYNTKQNPKKSAKEVSRYLNKQSKQVSDIFKQVREVENSDLSDAEKRKQVRELRELANTIELTTMAIVPEYEKTVDKYRGTFPDEDVDSEYAYLYANRDVFGAEYAVKTFSKALYNNHQKENMDRFFNNYFTKQYFQKKIEPETKSNSLPTQAQQKAKLKPLKK